MLCTSPFIVVSPFSSLFIEVFLLAVSSVKSQGNPSSWVLTCSNMFFCHLCIWATVWLDTDIVFSSHSFFYYYYCDLLHGTTMQYVTWWIITEGAPQKHTCVCSQSHVSPSLQNNHILLCQLFLALWCYYYGCIPRGQKSFCWFLRCI